MSPDRHPRPPLLLGLHLAAALLAPENTKPPSVHLKTSSTWKVTLCKSHLAVAGITYRQDLLPLAARCCSHSNRCCCCSLLPLLFPGCCWWLPCQLSPMLLEGLYRKSLLGLKKAC